MRRTARSTVLAPLALMSLATACAGDATSPATAGQSSATGEPAVSGGVTVFAAASLTDAFTAMGEAFTQRHPGADVTFDFGSSSALVAQINEGAPVDVYASADQDNMAKLTDAGNDAAPPKVFAKSSLEIAVEPGNPKKIAGLPDLQDPELIVVACAPDVPIGAYTAQVFENAGITVDADSFEENVVAVANKVALGEADAGIVYATDVIAARDSLEGVEIPADVNVTAEYPIVAAAGATNPDGAGAFVEFVLSDAGQALLRAHGFSAP